MVKFAHSVDGVRQVLIYNIDFIMYDPGFMVAKVIYTTKPHHNIHAFPLHYILYKTDCLPMTVILPKSKQDLSLDGTAHLK